MARTTVIDQLIIKLGLDPKDFTKGEKEVAASVLRTKKGVGDATGQMGTQLVGLARKWLSVAAAVTLVKKAADIIDDVAERTRRLGIDAQNYGTAADKLRNFENAIQMMGGSAEEARKTVGGFQQAIFDLAYNGQISDSLVMLARLGVQFQNGTGQARDFNDVMLDTADAIAKAQKQGMSRASAFQYLQQSGFDSGTSQLILSGRANIEAELARAQGRIQVNQFALEEAEKVRRASIEKDQQIEAFKVAELGGGAGNTQAAINQAIAHPVETLHKLGDAAGRAATFLEDMAIRATGSTRGLRNNNPGNLKAIGTQRRDREGFAVFGTMDEGIRKAHHELELYAKRGLNTIEKIIPTWAPKKDHNDVEAYIRDVTRDTGLKRDEVVDPSEYANLLGAMFKHESGDKAPDINAVADVLTMQDEAPAGATPVNSAMAAPPTPHAQGAVTNTKTDVHIDNISVNTRATDADGIAEDMDAAVQRKLLTSHAEVGMQ